MSNLLSYDGDYIIHLSTESPHQYLEGRPGIKCDGNSIEVSAGSFTFKNDFFEFFKNGKNFFGTNTRWVKSVCDKNGNSLWKNKKY